MTNTNYPNYAFKNKKLWLRDVRKRWAAIRKFIRHNNESVVMGCVFYPDEVYDWIQQFDKMDAKMKDYYKNV